MSDLSGFSGGELAHLLSHTMGTACRSARPRHANFARPGSLQPPTSCLVWLIDRMGSLVGTGGPSVGIVLLRIISTFPKLALASWATLYSGVQTGFEMQPETGGSASQFITGAWRRKRGRAGYVKCDIRGRGGRWRPKASSSILLAVVQNIGLLRVLNLPRARRRRDRCGRDG